MSQKPVGSGDHRVEKLGEDLTTTRDGNLVVIGKLWLTAAKTGLLGSIIPTVYAAAKPKDDTPQKPPKMRYKDLPLDSSPHYEYKNYLEDQARCPGSNRRMLHELILPCVSNTRKSCCQSFCEFSKDMGEIKGELCTAMQTQKNQFIGYMRSPDNLVLRQVVMAVGGLTGFYLGSGRFMFTRRFVYTGFGLLAAGALCFPKETDEAFRNFAYHTSKFILTVFNMFCNKNAGMREKLPCMSDLPPPPDEKKKRKLNECPPKPK